MGASGGFMLSWEAIPTWASGGSMGGKRRLYNYRAG